MNLNTETPAGKHPAAVGTELTLANIFLSSMVIIGSVSTSAGSIESRHSKLNHEVTQLFVQLQYFSFFP